VARLLKESSHGTTPQELSVVPEEKRRLGELHRQLLYNYAITRSPLARHREVAQNPEVSRLETPQQIRR
jgi:hypothetical protein